jgi:hypothetical protein
MDGVVSILPEPLHSEVEKIWDELADACGVQGINATPIPHFSWHVAERYHEEELKEALQQLSARIQPFQVQTAGLGAAGGVYRPGQGPPLAGVPSAIDWTAEEPGYNSKPIL